MPAIIYLKHKEDVITQEVADQAVLFDMVSGNYYSLNELGARIWELLDGSRTLQEVAEQLISEYDAPPEEIRRDLQSLAEDLLRNGLLLDSKAGPQNEGTVAD